jgi:hypothetical protein
MVIYRRPRLRSNRCYVRRCQAQYNPHVHVSALVRRPLAIPAVLASGAEKQAASKVRDDRGYVLASVPGQVELQEYSAIRRITRSNTRNASGRHFFKFIQVSFELGSF